MTRITKEERMRRLLMVFYDRLLISCRTGDGNLLTENPLLDATKDMVTDNENGMEGWSISQTGKIRFE